MRRENRYLQTEPSHSQEGWEVLGMPRAVLRPAVLCGGRGSRIRLCSRRPAGCRSTEDIMMPLYCSCEISIYEFGNHHYDFMCIQVVLKTKTTFFNQNLCQNIYLFFFFFFGVLISWICSFQHDLKTMLNWSLGEGLEMLYINSLRVKITCDRPPCKQCWPLYVCVEVKLS